MPEAASQPHSIRYIYKLTLLLQALLCLVGCDRELCYNHYRAIAFSVEWEREWERDLGAEHSRVWDDHGLGFEYADLVPEEGDGLTVMIYDIDRDLYEYHYVPHGSSDEVTVGEGRHSLMLFSNDTEHVTFNALTNPILAQATTTRVYRGTYAGASGEPTLHEPEMLYAAYINQIAELQVHDRLELEALMQPMVFTYVLKVDFDAGIEHVAYARGALSGMALGVYLRCGATTAETATILFDDCEITSDGVVARVRSFGLPNFVDRAYFGPWTDYVDQIVQPLSSADTKQIFTLEVMLTGGKIMTFDFDVSDQIQAQPAGGVVKSAGVVVRDEDNVVTGGGFDVTVGGWDDVVDIDLPISPL